jgi:hypothetical protein
MRRTVFAALFTLCVTTTVEAQQVWVSLGGGYASSGDEMQAPLTFSQYFETGLVTARYPGRGGVVIDASGTMVVSDRLSFATGVSVFRRTADAVLNGRVPHPLHFAQPRDAERELTSMTRRDVALRTELAWTRPVVSRLQMTLSGGPLVVHTAQPMAGYIAIREQGYPFDVVDLNPTLETESAWGFGFTAAVNASWVASPRVALGVTGRLSRANVNLRGHAVDGAGPALLGALQYRLR